MGNLLSNAITYGGDHCHITVKLTHTPEVSLAVIDDGPGIPPNELDKVFDRFYRIPASNGQGCGLGLAIVKEIADLHKAKLVVMPNHDNRGTQFIITFQRNNI